MDDDVIPTAAQIEAMPAPTGAELLARVRKWRGHEKRLERAVQVALNVEWWRGYYTAKAEEVRPWREVLGFSNTMPVTVALLKSRYAALAKEQPKRIAVINAAKDEALRELGV